MQAPYARSRPRNLRALVVFPNATSARSDPEAGSGSRFCQPTGFEPGLRAEEGSRTEKRSDPLLLIMENTMTASRLLLVSVLSMSGISFSQTRDADFAKLADGYFDEVLFRYDPAQHKSVNAADL